MRSILDNDTAVNRAISEAEKRSLDIASPMSDNERASANWIECKDMQSKNFNKRELNSKPHETATGAHAH